jgi:DNA-binding transcriptional ArsR family regulator
MPGDDLQITLTRAQVAEIVDSATEGESPAMLLRGMANPAAILDGADDGRLSRSLLRGFVILASLPRDRTSVGVSEIASRTGESASTTHRYLRTLLELGLIERDARSRRYCLTALVAPGSGENGKRPRTRR